MMTALSNNILPSVETLLAEASAETGLRDFGDEAFREALTRLVDASNKEGLLSAMGVAIVKGDIHRILVNRLRFAEDLKRHPEILEEDVSDPIVILGLPRTGTTKLQRFLSADLDVQRLEYWRLLNPAPFPNAVAGKEDPRIEVARQAMAMMAQLMPDWMAGHPQGAQDVDEEVFLQAFTFKSLLTYMIRPVPSFQTWMATQSLRSTYRYMKQMLQYLQWQDGGRVGKNGNRPWIMKTPMHVGTTDLLLEQCPNATLVFPHRKLHDVILSHCRLLESGRRMFSDVVDMNEIGRLCISDWEVEMKTHLKLRDEWGSRVQIFDIQYEQIRDNPIAVAREIYRRAGRVMTAERENAMLAWEAAHPQHPSGSADRKLGDYGLTQADIDSAFHEYLQRFGN